jgi:hypothetical protein
VTCLSALLPVSWSRSWILVRGKHCSCNLVLLPVIVLEFCCPVSCSDVGFARRKMLQSYCKQGPCCQISPEVTTCGISWFCLSFEMNFEIILISKVPETCFFVFQRALQVVAGIRLPVHTGPYHFREKFCKHFRHFWDHTCGAWIFQMKTVLISCISHVVSLVQAQLLNSQLDNTSRRITIITLVSSSSSNGIAHNVRNIKRVVLYKQT